MTPTSSKSSDHEHGRAARDAGGTPDAAPPAERAAGGPPTLGTAQFERIRAIVSPICGIDLPAGKEELVRSRLTRRLRALDLDTFDAYVSYLEREPSGREVAVVIDALTTNTTGFFREAPHFDVLRDHTLPALRARGGQTRIWSAGCSSGEEAYSIAMLVRDAWVDHDWRGVRVLATDISQRMLDVARAAEYDAEALRELPVDLVARHFTIAGGMAARSYRVVDAVRALVRIARLNLMDAWPMRGPFDVIFCRNVMIYFDRPTQQRLIQRFWTLLAPGGHLFVGHAESLAGLTHEFGYVRPAVYVK